MGKHSLFKKKKGKKLYPCNLKLYGCEGMTTNRFNCHNCLEKLNDGHHNIMKAELNILGYDTT
jgi:hypothetical protein